MAGSPNCPECATDHDVIALEAVGQAWRCPMCQEYFMAHELPDVPRKMRKSREWDDDE
jgi:transposase-like protein